MSEARRNRLFAIHAWLLAATVGFSAQEADWCQLAAVPLCSAANLGLWFCITRRQGAAGRLRLVLRRIPLLLLLPSLYFAGLSFRFASLQHASLIGAAVPMVSCFLAFAVAALVYSEADDAGPLLYALAVVGGAICVEGLSHEFVKTHGFVDLIARSPYRRDVAEDQVTRLSYPITYPNALATVLLFFSACTTGAIASARRPQERLVWAGLLLLNFMCIVLTGSRGGLITFLFIPIAYVAREMRIGRWIAAAGITLLIASVGWMLRKPYAKLRGSGSLLQRAHGWVVTLRIITRSPWFGEGPDAFRKEWAWYGPAHGYANQFGLDGFYANLLCEGGLVSLTVLSTLIIAAARETKRLLYTSVPKKLQIVLYYLAAGIGAILIHSTVESTLSSAPVVLAIATLFGLITGLRTHERRSRAADAPIVDWSGSSYSSGKRRQTV